MKLFWKRVIRKRIVRRSEVRGYLRRVYEGMDVE